MQWLYTGDIQDRSNYQRQCDIKDNQKFSALHQVSYLGPTIHCVL